MKGQISTLLKVSSIIEIIFAAIMILAAIVVMVSGGFVGSSFSEFAAQSGVEVSSADAITVFTAVGILIGVVILLGGLFSLALGICGVLGKLTAATVMVWVCIAISVISFIFTMVSGADIGTSLLSLVGGLVLPVLILFGIKQARELQAR